MPQMWFRSTHRPGDGLDLELQGSVLYGSGVSPPTSRYPKLLTHHAIHHATLGRCVREALLFVDESLGELVHRFEASDERPPPPGLPAESPAAQVYRGATYPGSLGFHAIEEC